MEKTGRKVLGKGLRALIPTSDTPARGSETGILQCPLDRLSPNEDQPRQSFDEGKLKELAESIRSKGVIQPLIVRRKGDGYTIIAGERRWRAARAAGLRTVPILVKEATDAEMLELALIENLQREDLNPIEEAEAYQALVEEHGYTQEQLAERVGRQRSTVANTLRLLNLPEEIRRYLLKGELSMGHARAILGVVGNNAQLALARKVVSEKLTVRQCEELVRRTPEHRSKSKGRSRPRQYTPAEYRVVESMQRRLGTKVDLRPKHKGGQVIIHYYAPGELDRIVSVIEGR
jgi:ParB family chromosome partitioning protein